MEKEKKPKQITLQLPGGPFGTHLYFNKCGHEFLEGNHMLYFGLTRSDGELLDTYCCMIEGSIVKENRGGWLKYLGQLGEPPEVNVDFTWKPSASKVSGVDFSNLIQFARIGNVAEFRIYSFSVGYALDMQKQLSKDANPVEPQPLALLRCALDLQKLLIMQLCEE